MKLKTLIKETNETFSSFLIHTMIGCLLFILLFIIILVTMFGIFYLMFTNSIWFGLLFILLLYFWFFIYNIFGG